MEVPLSPPPAPIIKPDDVERPRKRPRTPTPPRVSRADSMSPVPEGGAGDSLSIEETNRLRAKLGLKPLEVTATPVVKERKDDSKHNNLVTIKDDWGEFLHKPAENLAVKSSQDKMREKLKERKEKRSLEARLAKVKTLGESDSDDDAKKWVNKQKSATKAKEEAAKRAKMLEEMDEEFGVGEIVEQETRRARKKVYRDRDLQGLRVEHDYNDFNEGRQVILTLKDQDVLNEDGDTLVNVNMVDDERYKKSVANKKQKPNSYGYDVYEDQVDEYGMLVDRAMLSKYDEEIEGTKRSSFVLGDDAEEEKKRKRRLLEMKAKLNHKRLENLDTLPLTIASEFYTEDELTKFKKPKKKVKKLRQRLKADDLLAMTSDHDAGKDMGSRRKRTVVTDDVPEMDEDYSGVKMEADDDLEQTLAKARRLKQKEAIIQKPPPVEELVKSEIKEEDDDEEREQWGANIILNETAEFCRTLGDIPTYGLAGNRETDPTDLMDFDADLDGDIVEAPKKSGWHDPEPFTMEIEDSNDAPPELQDTAILDEEPDVAIGVGAALKLAMSKGYIEKEEKNRPSNARYAHLQAKHYSIEDKAHGEDDKYSRRDRYMGPVSEFREKEGFKPNVKLEYIDDSGRLLNSKEAFRYLSHKFHGKGPGKNKVEKRLKKAEQDVLMMKMSSTDTPLGTLGMLQQKQKETQSAYVVLSGNKQAASTSFAKN